MKRVGKKGLRLDQFLNINNSALSMEIYYFYLFDHKNDIDFTTNCKGKLHNRNVPAWDIYVFERKNKKECDLAKELVTYYCFNLDELYKGLSQKFYFYIIVKSFNNKVERIITPNEVFLTLESVASRCFAIMDTNNLLKVKEYYDHH